MDRNLSINNDDHDDNKSLDCETDSACGAFIIEILNCWLHRAINVTADCTVIDSSSIRNPRATVY